MNVLIIPQYLYKYAAVTNLANSKLLAIIITDNEAPANNLLKPNTEKNAAFPATNNAVNPSKGMKNLNFSKNKISLLLYY